MKFYLNTRYVLLGMMFAGLFLGLLIQTEMETVWFYLGIAAIALWFGILFRSSATIGVHVYTLVFAFIITAKLLPVNYHLHILVAASAFLSLVMTRALEMLKEYNDKNK